VTYGSRVEQSAEKVPTWGSYPSSVRLDIRLARAWLIGVPTGRRPDRRGGRRGSSGRRRRRPEDPPAIRRRDRVPQTSNALLPRTIRRSGCVRDSRGCQGNAVDCRLRRASHMLAMPTASVSALRGPQYESDVRSEHARARYSNEREYGLGEIDGRPGSHHGLLRHDSQVAHELSSHDAALRKYR